MIIEHVHEGVRYTLSNENLKVGDKVYPLADGRCLDGKKDGWILHGFDYKEMEDDPHTIIDLHYSDYLPYRIRTNAGFGPPEKYYKVIKKEVRGTPGMFGYAPWVELKDK